MIVVLKPGISQNEIQRVVEIGGSLALDARKRGLVGEIIGVGRGQANLRFAQRQGVIDRYVTTETDIPEDTDLLMMATPVQTTVSLTKTFLPRVTAGLHCQ